MRSWFSRGGASPAAAPAEADQAAQLLAKAQDALNRLRVSAMAPDFPALNTVTRLVGELEALVMNRMEGELKAVWRR